MAEDKNKSADQSNWRQNFKTIPPPDRPLSPSTKSVDKQATPFPKEIKFQEDTPGIVSEEKERGESTNQAEPEEYPLKPERPLEKKIGFSSDDLDTAEALKNEIAREFKKNVLEPDLGSYVRIYPPLAIFCASIILVVFAGFLSVYWLGWNSMYYLGLYDRAIFGVGLVAAIFAFLGKKGGYSRLLSVYSTALFWLILIWFIIAGLLQFSFGAFVEDVFRYSVLEMRLSVFFAILIMGLLSATLPLLARRFLLTVPHLFSGGKGYYNLYKWFAVSLFVVILFFAGSKIFLLGLRNPASIEAIFDYKNELLAKDLSDDAIQNYKQRLKAASPWLNSFLKEEVDNAQVRIISEILAVDKKAEVLSEIPVQQTIIFDVTGLDEYKATARHGRYMLSRLEAASPLLKPLSEESHFTIKKKIEELQESPFTLARASFIAYLFDKYSTFDGDTEILGALDLVAMLPKKIFPGLKKEDGFLSVFNSTFYLSPMKNTSVTIYMDDSLRLFNCFPGDPRCASSGCIAVIRRFKNKNYTVFIFPEAKYEKAFINGCDWAIEKNQLPEEGKMALCNTGQGTTVEIKRFRKNDTHRVQIRVVK